ncbi:Predicted DNA-binding transcriptional regulator YafY, contains an HTH and WYL domains [Alicyclobacillus macrosporangiidus]|uniref:Predicted DNA-binding transcriptional regulator YafY, contains an HTH and WYL domains n=2 Tax=Alicyclobacillus macrosporangiidus TaxID=392015 RepID=A0A1I7KW86_9BACL|nr:Predicted DNA-binding transcriptional regulator YafY, contains an HTH and WYL domains [Alicyclobacillus macrosporangiidus]
MRADRLLAILMYLRTEGKLTARELARRVEVSERTIYRDIDALSAIGVPIVSDAGAGGGFQLAEGFESTVEALTRSMSDTELESLLMNLCSMGFRDLAGVLPLRTVFLKLLHTLPPDKQRQARWIQNSIHLDPTPWHAESGSPEFIRMAKRAIATQCVVEFVYESAQGMTSSWRVQPYGLVSKAGLWFLVATDGDNMRAFRIARMRDFRLTTESFVRSSAFNLQAFWSDWVQKYHGHRASEAPGS